MAKIAPVSPETASEEVKAIYKEIGRATGGWIPNFYKTLAHRPPLLEGFWKMQSTLIFNGKVSRQHREMVNVFVALKNGCGYCVFHHSALALKVGVSKEKLDAVEQYAKSPLSMKCEVEKLILRYAEEYQNRPGENPEVIDSLSKHYSEEQLVKLNVLLGIANLANRFNGSLDIEIDHAPEQQAVCPPAMIGVALAPDAPARSICRTGLLSVGAESRCLDDRAPEVVLGLEHGR